MPAERDTQATGPPAVPDPPRRAPGAVETGALCAAVVVSVLVHGRFVLHGLGEPDAARLALQAVSWHQSGVPYLSYAIRTSPLYLHALKVLLDIGLPPAALPAVMNWTNVVAGGLTLVPMYLLWRKLANPLVAAAACVMFSLTPVFWYANIYGMPHLPSLGFFLTALLMFTWAIERPAQGFLSRALAGLLFATIAVAIKADVVLCFGAFLGVTIGARRLTARNVLWSAAIPVVALLVVVGETRLTVPVLQGLPASVSSWSTRFPLTWRALEENFGAGVPVNAVGEVMFYAIIVSLVYLVLWRRYPRQLALALLWALPPMAFWLPRTGGARHFLAAYSVLVFLVALAIYRPYRGKWLAAVTWAQVLGLLAWNYTASPVTHLTTSPSTRLIESHAHVQSAINQYHAVGEQFVALPPGRKLYFGTGTRPYVQWEVFARARRFETAPGRRLSDPWDTIVYRTDGAVDTVRTLYVNYREFEVDGSEGWQIWTDEAGLRPFLKIK